MPCFVYENHWISTYDQYAGPAEFILIEARNWEDASSYIKKHDIINLDIGPYAWPQGRKRYDDKKMALAYLSGRRVFPHNKFPVAIYYNKDKFEEYTVDTGGKLILIKKPQKTKNKDIEARRLMKKHGANENWGLF